MRAKILTLRYSATLGGFDDTPLLDFGRDKEIIAVREHFFVVHDTPHITCVVVYHDAVIPRMEPRSNLDRPGAAAANGDATTTMPPFQRRSRARDSAPDPCEGLDEAQRVLYNHLREWRARQAHQEGVPKYLVMTNRELVELVRRRPESATALGHIDGIGPGKVERYAGMLLGLLHGGPALDASPPSEQQAAASSTRDQEVTS